MSWLTRRTVLGNGIPNRRTLSQHSHRLDMLSSLFSVFCHVESIISRHFNDNSIQTEADKEPIAIAPTRVGKLPVAYYKKYRVGQKKTGTIFVRFITSPNIYRFLIILSLPGSKKNNCNNAINVTIPNLKCVLQVPIKKLNAMGSSRLVEHWEHFSELQGEYVEK